MKTDLPLGRTCTLVIDRFASPGAYLTPPSAPRGSPADTVLLPNAEVPDGARVGDEVRAFLYLDSEDRPIATTATPELELGQVAFLTVTDITNFGAFVAWGLRKELLVPKAEQTRNVARGERHAIGLYLDDTGRLAGTMRVAEMLNRTPTNYAQEQWVNGEAWRRDPEIGLFAIIERCAVGLVPKSEPAALERGQAARFRITNILPDGKIELSLRGLAHEELESDARRILDVLVRDPRLRVGDQSSPDEIRTRFGLSKKAFKRGIGRLLKRQQVRQDEHGFFIAIRTEAHQRVTPATRPSRR